MRKKRAREFACPLVPPEKELRRLQLLSAELQEGKKVPPRRWVNRRETPGLDRAVEDYINKKQKTVASFYQDILVPLIDSAVEFTNLFSVEKHDCKSFCAAWRNQAEYSLTQRQILSVLANAFFCCFSERLEEEEDDSLLSINYNEIHSSDSDVAVVKLQLFFDYVSLSRAADSSHKMEVFRTKLNSLSSFQKIAPTRRAEMPVIHPLGESIDDQSSMIRLDFANYCIGGGALSDGCVQEEITFAQCCGLNTLRWNHTPLQDTESVVVKGYLQCGRIKEGTYGGGIEYGEPFPSCVAVGGALAVVDALDYRFEPSHSQYTARSVRRELRKLLSALSHSSVGSIAEVAGGNWGCGVFGGDYELKFLIQWLACTLSGKRLHYFPFDNEYISCMTPTLRALVESGCRAEELLGFLTSIPKHLSEGEVWDGFVEYFGKVRETSTSSTDA